jgi:glutathione S-transferase
MLTLVYLPYSPWSEKARWALDHHSVPYDQRIHVPITGELPLRLQTRRFAGRISVPVLIADDGVLFDSFDIAQYAEEHGTGTPLFPPAHAKAIAEWNARSEAALAAGRKSAFRRALDDPETLEEGLAPLLPAPLRGPLRFVAKGAVAYMRRKYGIEQVDDRVLIESLDGLRSALRQQSYILGQLSYADIAMAVVLQFVRPVDDACVPVGPATRRTFGDPALAARYPDLLAWRDNLYAQHRRPSRSDRAVAAHAP